MDVATVSKDMFDAAQRAAGNAWGKIQHDFASDLGGVLRNAARIEEQLRVNALSEPDAEDLLRAQSNTLFILSQEAEVEAEVLAQNAINAAIDVLWTAVKAAAKFP
jgi:hypothetical protein